MGRIEDAYSRYEIARSLLDKEDYAGAIREAQQCVELSVKALLDTLNIDYIVLGHGKKKAIPHDVSGKIPEAFEKVKPLVGKHEFDLQRRYFAQAATVLRLLTAIKDHAAYGIKELQVGAKDIFDFVFAKELAKILVDLSHESYLHMLMMLDRLRSKSH